jgi:hypothetical protein
VQYFCCLIFCLQCLVLCCHYFTFSSTLDSHSNVSSSPISSLSMRLKYQQCNILFLHFSLITLPILTLCVVRLLFVSLLSFLWFSYRKNIALVLFFKVHFVESLLTFFTNYCFYYYILVPTHPPFKWVPPKVNHSLTFLKCTS